MKKLLWTGIVSLASVIGTAVAVRAANRIWRKVAHEPPPPLPKWAGFVAGRPLKKQIQQQMHN